jgi:uncharacterized cupredoxin-like copper-binding protein
MILYRLLFLIFVLPAAASAQPVDRSDVETVTITLSSFAFTPETIALEHGRPYRLVFVNTSSGGHNFVAPDFFRTAQIAGDDSARIDDGRIELEAGERLQIRVMIAEPGHYDVHCSHFMHSVFGMTGDIVVR